MAYADCDGVAYGVAGSRLTRYEQAPAISNKRRSSLVKAQITKSVKSATGKPQTATVRPVRDAFSKSGAYRAYRSRERYCAEHAKGVLTSLENAIFGSVHRRGAGEFTWPGVLKITLRKVSARKAGTLVRNPATGEMTPGAAKQASVRVKIRALSKLKSAASS